MCTLLHQLTPSFCTPITRKLACLLLVELDNHYLQLLDKSDAKIWLNGILKGAYPFIVFKDDDWWCFVVKHPKDVSHIRFGFMIVLDIPVIFPSVLTEKMERSSAVNILGGDSRRVLVDKSSTNSAEDPKVHETCRGYLPLPSIWYSKMGKRLASCIKVWSGTPSSIASWRIQSTKSSLGNVVVRISIADVTSLPCKAFMSICQA